VADPDDPRPIDERKAALRAEMRQRRAEIPAAERARLAVEARGRLLGLPELQAPRNVMVFASFGSEIPTEDLITGLRAQGHRVLLPIVEEDALLAVRFEPGDPMVETTYGPREPAARVPIDPDEIDVVIIPGLAFDRRGRRLGYGGSYYDRYLPLLSSHALKVGIGFHQQLVEEVPSGSGDVRLDMVVSDQEVVRCQPRDHTPLP
jgi:5-formyltetrahydrofolate cyclo-ligase